MKKPNLPIFEQAEPLPVAKKQRKKGMGYVLLVQCLCCVVLLLFLLAFRVFGGTAYAQLRGAFAKAMENNALLATVVELFEDRAPDETNLLSATT